MNNWSIDIYSSFKEICNASANFPTSLYNSKWDYKDFEIPTRCLDDYINVDGIGLTL